MIAAAADPRDVAREILHERRFHHAPFPQPLRKPLHSFGDAVRDAFNSAFHWTDGIAPGGPWVVWILLALVVVAVTVLVVRRWIGRSTGTSAAPGAAGDGGGGPSRRDLEREADAAERAGRFDEAVRLRFGAGLVGLARSGVVEERPSLRNAEVAESLGSDDFETLARSFDEVVYGGRVAGADDAREAREGWKDVLREARR